MSKRVRYVTMHSTRRRSIVWQDGIQMVRSWIKYPGHIHYCLAWCDTYGYVVLNDPRFEHARGKWLLRGKQILREYDH